MHVLIGLFSSLIIVGITLPSLCLERNDDPQKLQSMSSHVDPSTSSFYSFENQMVKTILRGGTTLRSGGNLSVEHTKDVAASLVTWLFAAFLGVFSQVKVNADGNLPMEQIKKGFLGRLGVNEASIWSELTVSTVLLLFDKNDDGIISKSEGTSLDQVHFMHLIDVLQNVDADQNGFSAADLQMAFLIESNDPDIEDIKRAYRAVKVSQQEVMDELHRLIDRFLAVDKQPKKPADTPARWMPQAVWGSTKMKVIMTAVIACILALVFWDHKKHKEGSQYRAVTQEVIRQQREQYLQSIGHQDPHNSTNDDLTTQRPNTRRESNEQLHKPSFATSGRLQNSVIASNKAPGDLGPKAKMQSVETVITPKTQEVTEKPAQKPRPKKPEAPQPRVISVEEEVVAVLSHVLDVEVHVRTSHLDQADPMRVLFLQSTDLHSLIIAAATGDSHSLTCAVQASQLGQLFDRRAAREWGKTVSFSTLCWNRSAERQLRRDNSPLITALLVRIKELATNLIITCLTEVISGEENDQDEGLWSSFKPDPNASVDLRFECNSLEKFVDNFADNPNIRFPRPIRPYCKRDVLVETFEEGEHISNFIQDDKEEPLPAGFRETLATYGLDALLQMIFVDNLVHGDLHSGNILVQNADCFIPDDENKLVLVDLCDTVVVNVLPAENPVRLVMLDVGICASLSERDLENFKKVFTAIVIGEGEKVAELMLKHSTHNECKDIKAFKQDLGAIVMEARKQTIQLGKIEVGRLLLSVFRTLNQHRVKMESNFASIILAIFVLEGIGRSLDPEVDILERSKPILLS